MSCILIHPKKIKKEVFEILKEELKNLKMAVDREKNKGKGKKGKKGGRLY
jgi:IQ and AAA domain-containing protein